MISAVIQIKTGANLTVEMPCDGYQISCQLWERGIHISPKRLKVSDDNDGGVRVCLTADDSTGEQLISVFSTRNSLSDVNSVANAVANARPEVRREMEQRILSGRYSTPDEVIRDTRAVTQDMAPVKLSFYCPLKGQIDEWDGDMDDTCNSTLLEHQEKIEELLEEEQQPEDGDMAEYLVGDNADLYAKLYLAEFCVEEIIGQAADGFGEHFEQQPIRIDEGDLYVSFWDSGDDYFMYTEDEMEAYLNGSMAMGGMT